MVWMENKRVGSDLDLVYLIHECINGDAYQTTLVAERAGPGLSLMLTAVHYDGWKG